MSNYICVFDRSGHDVDRQLLRHLAEPLEINNASIEDVCQGPCGVLIGHDAAHSRQRKPPSFVVDPETGITLVVTGQINFFDPAKQEQNTNDLPIAPSPANQAFNAFLKKDLKFLNEVSGSFILIIFDPKEPSMTVARSHLGDLKMYYYLDQRWLIAASEPAAILHHATVANDIDEGAVARFLGFRFSHTTTSFFRQIKELPAAHWLRITPDAHQTKQYWRFNYRSDVRQWAHQEVCSEFVRLLRQSVSHQLADMEPGKVALSLSGGLDSTALAALTPPDVRLLSWYFEDSPECDERENIKLVSDHLRKPVVWVCGDGLHPLCGDYIDRFVSKNSPVINAFAALKYQLYRSARAQGCERIMVGDAGDVIYSARDYWLRDSLTSGAPGSIASLVKTILRARNDAFARMSLRRLLPVRHIRARFYRQSLPWLTRTANAMLPKEKLTSILPEGARKYRFDPGVGSKHIDIESEEQRLFTQSGVGRSNPYWNWPLLEMVLSLPAYWYQRDCLSKILTREAMKGLLPERLLLSKQGGLLGRQFLKGIEMSRKEIRQKVFIRPRSDWQRYVDRSWVEPYLSATGSIAFGHTILWRMICYELWYRRVIR